MAGTVKVNNVQLGDSITAGNNFVLSVPSTPDGTLKLVKGSGGTPSVDNVINVDVNGDVTGKGLVHRRQLHGKNLVLNGSCDVNQRETSSVSTNGTRVADGFSYYVNYTSNITLTNPRPELDPENIFESIGGSLRCIKATVGTGRTFGLNDYATITLGIEGINTEHLFWGTSNAKPVSLQFKVQSSVAGTYSVAIRNLVSGDNVSYVATFTIDTANVPQLVKIENILGPTASIGTANTWKKGAEGCIGVDFTFGAGGNKSTSTPNAWVDGSFIKHSSQPNFASTTGATFYITDIQLEEGIYCTEFERKSQSENLSDCLRYLQVIAGDSESVTNIKAVIGTGRVYTTTEAFIAVHNKLKMRANPSVIIQGDLQYNNTTIPNSICSVYDSNRSSILLRILSTGLLVDTPVHLHIKENGLFIVSAEI